MGSFNFTGTTESLSKSSYQQGCPLLPAPKAEVWKVVSPLFLLKPEILLMPFGGSSTARALDLLCLGYMLPPQELPHRKTTQKEKSNPLQASVR